MEQKFCHIDDIDNHNCIDSTACRYGMPDGPDDILKECDCDYGN
jgi:hypothetical protein